MERGVLDLGAFFLFSKRGSMAFTSALCTRARVFGYDLPRLPYSRILNRGFPGAPGIRRPGLYWLGGGCHSSLADRVCGKIFEILKNHPWRVQTSIRNLKKRN